MNSRARVALVVTRFPVLSETFIVAKFLGLLERGWDVHIVCSRLEVGSLRSFPKLSSSVRHRIHVNPPTEPHWRAALAGPRVLMSAASAPRATGAVIGGLRRYGARGLARRWYLGERLIALAPSIVHFEFGTVGRDGVEFARLLGAKSVVSFRGYDLYSVQLEDPDHYRSVWSEADAVHLLGEDLWRHALRRGCPADKLHSIIPPAVDLAQLFVAERRHIDVCGSAARPLRIASVGRLDWKKGHEYALVAVRILRDRGIRCAYRIIGGGPYLEAVAYARHQLGLGDCVELCGPLPPAQVRDELRCADVFLHAAVSEGFCNAVIEAQAMQIPIVTSNAGGLPENVADSETAFVVARRDPHAMAERLFQLATDPELRDRMGRAGRDRARRLFKLEDQITAFDNLYRKLLAEA